MEKRRGWRNRLQKEELERSSREHRRNAVIGGKTRVLEAKEVFFWGMRRWLTVSRQHKGLVE